MAVPAHDTRDWEFAKKFGLPIIEVVKGNTESNLDEAEMCIRDRGSDMLLSFDSWHRWQEILRLARLVVTSRNVGDAPELHAKAKQMDPTGARILFAQVSFVGDSLTQGQMCIRDRFVSARLTRSRLLSARRSPKQPASASSSN